MKGNKGDSSTQSTSAEQGDGYTELQKQIVDGDDTEGAAQFLPTQAIPVHHNTPSTPKTVRVSQAQWRMGLNLAFGALMEVLNDRHKPLKSFRVWEKEQDSVLQDTQQKTQGRNRGR